MALATYQKKRKFAKTPEPKGETKNKGASRFVVQKHDASHLHYDFRLELPASPAKRGEPERINKGLARLPKVASGDHRQVVLKSWAVPKGVPKRPGAKHLAVAVEDHPVDYINFQGIIPPGNYGAGKVEIWDKGKFVLLAQTPRSLKFELKGKKLKGSYVLFQLKGKNWLMFRIKN